MRLSLKELLAIVTFAAGIAACAAQVGFTNGLFWTYAVLAGVMSSLFVWVAAGENGRRGAWAIPIPFALCSVLLMFISLALWVNAGLLIAFGIVCAFLPPMPRKRLATVTILCVLASCVYGVYAGGDHKRELVALRKMYPIVSLEPRLGYEAGRKQSEKLVLLPKADKELAVVEQQGSYRNYRQRQLAAIHGRFAESFMTATGFGVTRMPYPTRESIERPELQNIAFQDRRIIPPEYSYRSKYLGIENSPHEGLSGFHQDNSQDFLDPEAFGDLIEPPKRVVGFVAHGFHEAPSRYESGLAWDLERLELVSLLKFDEPRVYVLDHLPRMDQLSGDDVPTRPLDKFESTVLPRLRTDEDLVIDEIAGQTRMLGSLRAAKQCTACHAVPRGELLGAFTYVLRQQQYPLPPQ